MENVTDSSVMSKKIELDDNGVKQLTETRKWSMFLAIAGFVVIGLLVIAPLVILMAGSRFGVFSGMQFLPLILIVVIYFFPVYYIYQFSSYSKRALDGSDSGLLATAFKYLKMHYKYMGILFIVVIGFYVVIILTVLLTGGLFSKYFSS